MNKKQLVNLDIDIYEEKLSNGLEVYILPFNNKNGIYVTFTTKFGSRINEFVPINEDEMIKVPDGIAHFLEHKVFEQEDGIDPFSLYSERGADCNANTSCNKTTYLFSCTDFFKKNLKLLLKYVTSPYFTDQNVLKEKGIIEQEIKMYDNDPYSKLYETILYNSFVVNPVRIPVGGTVSSVNSITKEDLYECYNTFYNPSNMFLVITGNVDVKNTMSIIKDFYKDKKYDNIKNIVVKEYNEPDTVYKEREVLNLNVNIPKVSINFKTKVSDKLSLYKQLVYLNIYLDIKFGTTSLFMEKLKKEGILNFDLSVDFINTKNHILAIIIGETKKQDKLINYINDEINNKDIDEKEFERKKKTIISSLVYMSDNIYSINHKVLNNIVEYNEIIYDNYNIIKEMNIKEFRTYIDSIDFKNNSIVIVNPK